MKKQFRNLVLFFTAVVLLTSCNTQEVEKQASIEKKNYVVKEQLAKKIALQMLSEKGKNTIVEKDVTISSLNDANEDPYFYIVNEQGKNKESFVIVSGDKRLEPVLAYGNEIFDLEDAPEELKFWMKGYTNKIDYLRQEEKDIKEVSLKKFDAKVERVGAKSSLQQRKENEHVSQLIETSWGQRCVYNSFSPKKEDIDCEDTNFPCGRAYTGCVATCLSQVVNYYEAMDGYNYSILKNNYVDSDLGTASGNEVGKLMKEIGDIMKMKYTCTGSLSYTGSILKSEVRESLGFDEQLKYKRLNSMNLDDVYAELKAKHPIIISGKDYNNGRRAGHLWVLDGFTRYYGAKEGDDTVYFHFNLGWNGRSNGWYLYNDFNLGSYNLNHYVTMYYNFRKNN
ncbi:C10 family peptidase [Tenacibaculum sp. 190524A02b]|uniref:C10 family peptidase n=1 Tax=Tenacibaculum vairaonense TaxID=3137860 RepID=UPI0032B19B4B